MQSKNMKSMSRIGFIVILVTFFICLGLMGEDIYAAKQSKPLLIPGKRTLYQKVITHPGSKLYALAGNSAKVLGKWVKPFTVFYVYQRASVGGKLWMEVGLSSTEGPIGWIKGSKTSDWNQALTLVFTERTGRQPALFFKDLKSLQKIAGSQSPGEQALQLESQFATIRSRSISPPANSRYWLSNHKRKPFRESSFTSCRFFKHLTFLKVLNSWKSLPLIPAQADSRRI